jgi:hypothetical protein
MSEPLEVDIFDTTKHTKALMIDALEKSYGIVTVACRNVGVSRQTHYNWIRDDKEYSSAVMSISEVSLDFVEGKLLSMINDGNATAAIFYLKTKGRARGYIERVDLSGKLNLNDNITITRKVINERD